MITLLLTLCLPAHAISPEKEVDKALKKLAPTDDRYDLEVIRAVAAGLSTDGQSFVWLDLGKSKARLAEGCMEAFIDARNGRDDALLMVDALRLAVAAGGASSSDAEYNLRRRAPLLSECGVRLAQLVRRGEPAEEKAPAVHRPWPEPKDALARALEHLELAEEFGGPTLATSSWLAILYNHQGRAQEAGVATGRLATLPDDPAVEPSTLAEAYRTTAVATPAGSEALISTGLLHLEGLKTSRAVKRSAFDTSERTEDPIVALVDAAKASLRPGEPASEPE